ncbi:hypothetical protein BP6252_10325 [Coleophoma cylindrospora]|uniref:Glycoside hydrolase family 43 protein n=1 Tax=Coleophoma cylindrospora TaxID=1849047 RepID=A0A3D8QT37_9HELO|nr:hypothetical protein BP6252_10325 [Coleophoma cylindrospora]
MRSLKRSLLLAGALQACLTTAYQNPVQRPGPDPSMVYADGMYYLTHTSYSYIGITKSTTLAGLINGTTKTIWTDSDPTKNANMWAPEMHQIDETWYMFYSSCNSLESCCDSCRTRVLQGCEGPNPYDCTYTYLAELIPPVGYQGGPNKTFAFAIDGTYLEIPGRGRYHVVSANDANNQQAIQITMLNTTSWKVAGWNVISVPDQAWELNGVPVNEGPHPLYHNGEIWLSYSGSYCGTPYYALGLLHYTGGDPLLQSSWNKTGPVLSQANGNYGTGHNCFFQSPDGSQVWNAFHATSNSAGSCGSDRYTMAQIVNFSTSNVPSLGIPMPLSAMLTAPSGE